MTPYCVRQRCTQKQYGRRYVYPPGGTVLPFRIRAENARRTKQTEKAPREELREAHSEEQEQANGKAVSKVT